MSHVKLAKELTTFIRSLYPGQNLIPLHAPIFLGNERKYVIECIDSTFVSSVGQYVNDFEKELSKYTGANAAVLCVNGTEALRLALYLIGARGYEVLTQPLSFVATVNAIIHEGGYPVFIDIDSTTLSLSPEALSDFLEKKTELRGDFLHNKLTNRPIKAVVPIHTFGHPVRIEEIKEICDHYSLNLIEDAAESLGSLYKGKHTGTFGEIGVISFNGNKVITTGGGGVLLFKDEALASHAKHLTTQARISHSWEFEHDHLGFNLRMPNINAAIGLAQLEKLPHILGLKRELARRYADFCVENDLQFVNEPAGCTSNYWLNTIICESKGQRDFLLKYTNQNKVTTRPAWKLLNELPFLEKCQSTALINAKKISESIISLPSSAPV